MQQRAQPKHTSPVSIRAGTDVTQETIPQPSRVSRSYSVQFEDNMLTHKAGYSVNYGWVEWFRYCI